MVDDPQSAERSDDDAADTSKGANGDAGGGKPDPDAAVLAQADNPDAVQAALERERERRRKAVEELQTAQAQVRQFQDKDKTEQQKAAEKAAEAEKRALSAEARALRYEVAAEAELPLKFATRLVGDDRDALVNDANELKKELGGEKLPRTDFEGGARAGSSTDGNDMDALMRGQLARRR